MTRQHLFALSSLPAAAGLAVWWLDLNLGLAGVLLRTYALAFLIGVSLWLLSLGLRVFLWRVGRRLTFSYFLIGVVPIPLFLVLVLVASYIAAGFFLGHVYRDAKASLVSDLRFAAHSHMEQILNDSSEPLEHPIDVHFAYYRDGVKLAGIDEAPRAWQSWWHVEALPEPSAKPEDVLIVAGASGEPTLAVAVRDGAYGIVAIFAGDLSRELSERSGVWVELFRSDDPRTARSTKITVGNREYPLDPPHFESAPEDLKAFFHPDAPEPGLLERPSMTWVEISQPFRELAGGDDAARYVSATLTTNLEVLYLHLVSPTSEVNLFVYLVLVGVAFLLLNIAVVAALMALMMITGLSRAVNQLSAATGRVRRGDFSARIEVRRRDQVGALQNAFNQMAANLENLVATAAQKEILEKEISIAQDLQRSLLPDTLVAPSALRFAAHFEPSTAIGGDYYDLLPMNDGRLAVMIADVSGHGLSAGLRMAMVKSALALLCEEEDRPEEILRRLHHLIRHRLASGDNGRGFVTATLSLVDAATGELVVTNAGHPPTYLLRGGEVTEIVLPSSPLGAFGDDFGQTRLWLEPGDVVVWLSDGLIEASNAQEEDFGYQRVLETLAGLEPEPAVVRARLLEAIARHTGGGSPEDDRTLLVMAYRGAEKATRSDASSPKSA